MIRKSEKKDKSQRVLAKSREHPEESDPLQPHSQEHPRICLIDVEEKICETLKSSNFNCFVGTLGSVIEIPNRKQNDSHSCRLHYEFPPNLHEYDIVVIDLQNCKRTQYRFEDHTYPETRGSKQDFFVSCFPETLFDPRPKSSEVLKSRLQALLKRETLLIVFAAKNEKMEYSPAHLTAQGWVLLNTEEYRTYDFFPELSPYRCKNITGRDTEVLLSGDTELGRLLQNHNHELCYRITFSHPLLERRGKDSSILMENDVNFVPLIVNGENEIVSFAYTRKQNHSFFFPQITRKEEFLLALFQRVLPGKFPKLFPYSTQFAWLKDPLYRLPNEGVLLEEKTSLQIEYEQKLKEVDERIQANQERYRHLHNLLIQSGDELVKTVEGYFKWLGFENGINVDETNPDTLEEDLQVETEKGLLVVEVKGIGGTSTDSQCFQINKIRHRRVMEHKRFNVCALYLVNHQRFLPPDKRKNPPFNEKQIQDAGHDERGLLSTYELFKLYFNIEAGFVTKEDARDALFQTGLVRFPPSNAVRISSLSEIHYNGYVGILQLEDIRITAGMEVILEEDGFYKGSVIEEIQIERKTVDAVESGEVGIKFADKVTKRTQLWLKVDS